MSAAAVVLAGGRSSRMGSTKAALPWHGSTLLRHVCGLVARGVDGPVLVVRASGQPLPHLPANVEVIDDVHADLGPMEGIAVGLAALQERADIAFVCGTDVPLLQPAFVRRIVRASATSDRPFDIVLPHAHGHDQPLAGAYRSALAPTVAELVAADRLRLGVLIAQCAVLRLDEPALRAVDPDLDSLVNLNEPADYAAAHARPEPLITLECLGVLATAHGAGSREVRAATVASAAEAAGVMWDAPVLATVNGDQIGRDGTAPLVAGDVVSLRAADPSPSHAS
jgi:molybdopterin-guanine dinucleotide biosynthesis protein A